MMKILQVKMIVLLLLLLLVNENKTESLSEAKEDCKIVESRLLIAKLVYLLPQQIHQHLY